MDGWRARFWYGLRSKRRRVFEQSERAFTRALHFDAELHEPSRAVQDLCAAWRIWK
jgi:hypothetical protein